MKKATSRTPLDGIGGVGNTERSNKNIILHHFAIYPHPLSLQTPLLLQLYYNCLTNRHGES
jgi:hypothetical protein